MSSMKPPQKIKKALISCPQCGEETIYSEENPSRPFCSDRCQTLDLGAWATEKFALPYESSKEGEEEQDWEEKI